MGLKSFQQFGYVRVSLENWVAEEANLKIA